MSANPQTSKEKPSRKKPSPKLANLSPQDRHRMIEENAYLLAEQRGFQSDPLDNWLQAESEVDAVLVKEKK